jgi:hypothetical protein
MTRKNLTLQGQVAPGQGDRYKLLPLGTVLSRVFNLAGVLLVLQAVTRKTRC